MLGMCEIMWIPTKYFHFLISEALCCCNRAFNSLSLFSMSIFRWRAKMKDNNAEMNNRYFKLILFHVLDVYFENIWSHFQYRTNQSEVKQTTFNFFLGQRNYLRHRIFLLLGIVNAKGFNISQMSEYLNTNNSRISPLSNQEEEQIFSSQIHSWWNVRHV